MTTEPVKYREYINSLQWKAFRARWFNDSSLPNLCVACGGSSVLELHHVTYERLGNERLNDLVPLCHRCHIEFHERFTSHQSNGLHEFQDQLRIAFRLSREVVAIRLRPFLEFRTDRSKPRKESKANTPKATRRQKKALKALRGATRFQAYHDKHSPKRYDPFA